MAKWWEGFSSCSRQRVVLLQVDIGGHSAWAASASDLNIKDACLERILFAHAIRDQLEPYKYHELFWAGDGGIFAAKHDDAGHPVHLCEVADRVFEVFENWKLSKDVELRVTATSIEVSIGAEPGTGLVLS